MVGKSLRALAALWFASVSLIASTGIAVEAAPADKTLAPFFVIEHGDPAIDQLPLEDTKVDVAISDVVAEVTVTQVYENRGKRAINTKYVFPASTRAAVRDLPSAHRSEDRRAQAGAKELRESEGRGQNGDAARGAAPERIHAEPRERHARRPHPGFAQIQRTARPDRGQLRLRFPDGRRSALLESVRGHGARNVAIRRHLPPTTASVPRRSRSAAFDQSASRSASLASRRTRSTRRSNANLSHFSLDPSSARPAATRLRSPAWLAGSAFNPGLTLFNGAGGCPAAARGPAAGARTADADLAAMGYVFIVDRRPGSMADGAPIATARVRQHLEELSSSTCVRRTRSACSCSPSGSRPARSTPSLPATPQARHAGAFRDSRGAERGGTGGSWQPAKASAHAQSSTGRSRSFVASSRPATWTAGPAGDGSGARGTLDDAERVRGSASALRDQSTASSKTHRRRRTGARAVRGDLQL